MSTATEEQVWTKGAEGIVIFAPRGPAHSRPEATYERVTIERLTPAQLITTSGLRFRLVDGREVGGPRGIIPPWAPAYPIFNAQITADERRDAVGTTALAFTRDPSEETARAVRDAVDAYLEHA